MFSGENCAQKKLEQYNEKQEAESKTGERRTVIFTRMGESRRNTMKATLSVDGEKKNYVLSNKKAIVAMDYNAHMLSSMERAENINPYNGGARPYTFDLTIPKGQYDYRFQIELLYGAYTSIRPYAGSEPPQITVSTTVGILATTLINVLLDEEIREKLRSTKNSAIQIVIEKRGWKVYFVAPYVKEAIIDDDYDVFGDYSDQFIKHLEPPQACENATKEIFDNYLQWLPDYEKIGSNLLRFVETPVEFVKQNAEPAKETEQ